MSAAEPLHLLVTSGDGPRECRRAVALVLQCMEKEAIRAGIRFGVQTSRGGNADADPSSALVTLTGGDSARIAKGWIGTVQWTCASPFRPQHKRQNWFVGVFEIDVSDSAKTNLEPNNLKVETFRSGGPGGQHQNTTDSGVRLVHLPTGISATSTDERSQHRNRQVALERLRAKLILKQQEVNASNRNARYQLHKQLQRGNPVRKFKGERFKAFA